MKKIKNTKKPNFLKKIFIKLCRIIGYEIIDQSSLYLPTSEKLANKNLTTLGKKIINVSLGETKISRSVKSLDIIIKTCTSVNLVTQNKKRVFEQEKSEYTFRTINSIIKSLYFYKDFLQKIKTKIYVIDYNSKQDDIKKINNILSEVDIDFEIINLNLDDYKQIRTLNKNNHIIEENMRATMASIHKSLTIAKENCDDLIYFVEDDYIHKKESLFEIVSTYEKIASVQNKDLFMCPVDYPYLYKNFNATNIFIGNKYHWRTVKESLLTFLTSKSLLNKYWDDLKLMCENEHSPFESPLHLIYEKELCISPVPSLAMHCTNVNSVFGLSPNIDWLKLWKDNEV